MRRRRAWSSPSACTAYEQALSKCALRAANSAPKAQIGPPRTLAKGWIALLASCIMTRGDDPFIDEQNDPVLLDQWHVVASIAELRRGPVRTVLLGRRLTVAIRQDQPVAHHADGAAAATMLHLEYVWVCLGQKPARLFDIPELAEPERRVVHAGSFGVRTSPPRAIENFLDLGHFPYVHKDFLGLEPHTEVLPYRVSTEQDGQELFARDCRFFQPRSAANASEGFIVEYVYRVPHPLCAVLYKLNPLDRDRQDVIALFCQPVGPEQVRAHMLVSLFDDTSDDAELIGFQQLIFAQDKPILENQVPLRLPLSPGAEVPVRADAMSVAYRRYLAALGLRHGVIAA